MDRRSNWLATLDIVNEAFLYEQPLPAAHREAFAEQIVSQSSKLSQTTEVFTEGLRLFSGEKLRTRFAARHILQEESARVLTLLAARTVDTRKTLGQINASLLKACFAQSCVKGECAHATIGLLRYLAAGRLDKRETRLNTHLRTLSQHRDGNSQWEHFPFYYTLLALTEIDLPLAIQEMHYAAPTCEQQLRRISTEDPVSQRRRAILQRVLSMC